MKRLYAAWAVLLMSVTSGLLAQTKLVSAKPPAYPLAAKAAGIDGAVTLKGTITKDGTLRDVQVVNGPRELREAALAAVSSWVYKPYRHFGHPVDVDTTITVNFDMGHGQKKAEEQAKAKAELARMGQGDTPQAPSPTNDEEGRK